MTCARVTRFETSVTDNSSFQDYTHADDQTQSTYDMTPGFKTFHITATFTLSVPFALLTQVQGYKTLTPSLRRNSHYSELTWYPLTSFGFNLLYYPSQRSERHGKYMTAIGSYLPQLRFLISSSNSKHEHLTASTAKTASWRAYSVLGYAIGKDYSHSFSTTCGSPPVDKIRQEMVGDVLRLKRLDDVQIKP